MLPNAQLSQKRQRLHIPISPIAQLFQKTQKMQISRGLGTPPQPPTQDLWRFAFFEFFETVVQLVRTVYANVEFFETVVHLVRFVPHPHSNRWLFPRMIMNTRVPRGTVDPKTK